MNLTMVPMWVLSGVFFSSSNFPEVVQPVIRALPLTALVDALRAVVLEGATLGGIRVELATLAAWAIVPFAIGLRIFKWRYESESVVGAGLACDSTRTMHSRNRQCRARSNDEPAKT